MDPFFYLELALSDVPLETTPDGSCLAHFRSHVEERAWPKPKHSRAIHTKHDSEIFERVSVHFVDIVFRISPPNCQFHSRVNRRCENWPGCGSWSGCARPRRGSWRRESQSTRCPCSAGRLSTPCKSEHEEEEVITQLLLLFDCHLGVAFQLFFVRQPRQDNTASSKLAISVTYQDVSFTSASATWCQPWVWVVVLRTLHSRVESEPQSCVFLKQHMRGVHSAHQDQSVHKLLVTERSTFHRTTLILHPLGTNWAQNKTHKVTFLQ